MSRLTPTAKSYENFGHRTGWPFINSELRRQLPENRNTQFDDFIEDNFSWNPGKAQPYLDPWAGISHCPRGDHIIAQSFRRIPWNFKICMPWRLSLGSLKCLIVLSEHHRDQLGTTSFPTEVVLHPTTFGHPMWNPELFMESRRLLQIGEWLKNTHLLQSLAPSDFSNLVVRKNSAYHLHCEELKRHWNILPPVPNNIEELEWVSHEKYDQLLSSSVIVSELYDASANNIVVESIVRATPHVINKHPAAVEYFGENYPLFYTRRDEILPFIRDSSRVMAAHHYLLLRRKEPWLHLPNFVKSVTDILDSCLP